MPLFQFNQGNVNAGMQQGNAAGGIGPSAVINEMLQLALSIL